MSRWQLLRLPLLLLLLLCHVGTAVGDDRDDDEPRSRDSSWWRRHADACRLWDAAVDHPGNRAAVGALQDVFREGLRLEGGSSMCCNPGVACRQLQEMNVVVELDLTVPAQPPFSYVLPEGALQFPQLRVLTTGFMLRGLPSLAGLPALETLEVRDTSRLKQLPDSFASLPALSTARLANLPALSGLPASLPLSPSLERLVLSDVGEHRWSPLAVQALFQNASLANPGAYAPSLREFDSDKTRLDGLPVAPRLQAIRATGAGLTDLPADLFKACPDLRNLTLRGNALPAVLDYSGNAALHLELLDLSQNLNLEEVRLGDAASLRVLNLSSTSVSVFPAGDSFPGLRDLDVSRSAISELPDPFPKFPVLEKLALRELRLETLPNSLSNATLPALVLLDVHASRLVTLPETVTTLRLLRELDLSDGRLIALPAQLGALVNLETLLVMRNELRALPESISGLHRLTTLDASVNGITSLPSDVRAMRSLRLLGLDLTNVGALPALPSSLIELSVFDANLTCLNGVNWEELAPSLRALNLAGNSISALPASFSTIEFPSLEFLQLSGNRIQTLNGTALPFPRLKILWMENNVLSDLPDDIGLQIPNAVVLDLRKNRLRRLPPSLVGMRRLVEIRISRNVLIELPPDIGNLTDLRVLDASFNRLTALPLSMLGLGQLQVLNLGHNWLHGYEYENVWPAFFLKSLLVLDLSHNQLVSPPRPDCMWYEVAGIGSASDEVALGFASRLLNVDLSYNVLPTSDFWGGDLYLTWGSCFTRGNKFPQLASLELSSNALTSFSSVPSTINITDGQISTASKLQILHLNDNPIRFVQLYDLAYLKTLRLDRTTFTSDPLLARPPPGATMDDAWSEAYEAGDPDAFDGDITDGPLSMIEISSLQRLTVVNLTRCCDTYGVSSSNGTSPPGAFTLSSSQQTRFAEFGLSCSSIVSAESPSQSVILDPAYLHFAHCYCPVSLDDVAYWDANERRCRSCPAWVRCDGRVWNPRHAVIPGYYPVFDGRLAKTPDEVVQGRRLRCHRGDICNPDSETEFECKRGHDRDSMLCSKCSRSYYAIGAFCFQCPSSPAFAVFSNLAFVAVAIAWVWFKAARSSRGSGSGSLNIFVAWVQVSALILAQITAPSSHAAVDANGVVLPSSSLPSPSSSSSTSSSGDDHAEFTLAGVVQALAETVSLSPFAVECMFGVSDVFAIKFAIKMTMPLVLAVFAAAGYFALPKAMREARDGQIKRRIIFVYLFFLNALYLTLAQQVLELFACHSDDDAEVSYLQAAPYIDCSSRAVLVMRIFAGLGLVLYIVAIPAGFAFLLHFHRHQLDTMMVRELIGFLYLSLRHRFFYWEALVITMRKLFIVAAATLIPSHESAVVFVVIFAILFASTLIQAHKHPYQSKFDNIFELSLNIMASLTYFAGLMANLQSLGAKSDLVEAVVLCNFVVGIVALLAMARRKWRGKCAACLSHLGVVVSWREVERRGASGDSADSDGGGAGRGAIKLAEREEQQGSLHARLLGDEEAFD